MLGNCFSLQPMAAYDLSAVLDGTPPLVAKAKTKC